MSKRAATWGIACKKYRTFSVNGKKLAVSLAKSYTEAMNVPHRAVYLVECGDNETVVSKKELDALRKLADIARCSTAPRDYDEFRAVTLALCDLEDCKNEG